MRDKWRKNENGMKTKLTFSPFSGLKKKILLHLKFKSSFVGAERRRMLFWCALIFYHWIGMRMNHIKGGRNEDNAKLFAENWAWQLASSIKCQLVICQVCVTKIGLSNAIAATRYIFDLIASIVQSHEATPGFEITASELNLRYKVCIKLLSSC